MQLEGLVITSDFAPAYPLPRHWGGSKKADSEQVSVRTTEFPTSCHGANSPPSMQLGGLAMTSDLTRAFSSPTLPKHREGSKKADSQQISAQLNEFQFNTAAPILAAPPNAALPLSSAALKPLITEGNIMNKHFFAAAALALASLSAQAADIVDTAVSAGNFKTLVTALKAADLVDTLKGPGPFTVFAPTDAAFAKIPKADLDALLADKTKLKSVLTYHVVAGKVMSADIKAGKVKTVQGTQLTVATMGGVMVDKAKVVSADVAADNGVIHAIDTVLMPK